MIRVLLAEDHAMVRAGLRALLERSGNIEIVGEASNGHEAIEMVTRLEPDLLIMDIMMPRLNGVQSAEQIRALKIPVNILILSMYSDEGLIRQALRNGVKGYVLKSSVSNELLEAIQTISNGGTYLSSELSDLITENIQNPHLAEKRDPIEILSPREKEILQLITEEHTSAEIAKILFISEKTVEKHRTNIMDKLNIHNLAGLVKFAIKYGLANQE
ncbi:MAG: response regulator transcription factor [Anaerolineales bacterium]|nr:response regulator transcription factor [Anaerolineales bacterium]